MKFTWLFFLLAHFTPAVVRAENVFLNIIVDSDPSSVSDSELDVMIRIAAAKLHDAGFDLRVKRIDRRVLPNVTYEWGDAAAYGNAMAFSRIISKRGYNGRRVMNFFVLRPIEINGFRQVVASAYGICSYLSGDLKAYAAEFADPLRPIESGIVMAHEIAHLLGAAHTAEELPLNVMNPYISAYIGRAIRDRSISVLDSVGFSASSIDEMNRCRRRNTRRERQRSIS